MCCCAAVWEQLVAVVSAHRFVGSTCQPEIICFVPRPGRAAAMLTATMLSAAMHPEIIHTTALHTLEPQHLCETYAS